MPIGSGIAAQIGVAEEVYTNEVQTLTGAPGGTFTLTFDGATTTVLAAAETAINIQNALNALPNIGAAGVACAGGPISTTPVTVTFGGTPLTQKRGLPLITSSLANPVATRSTPGTGYGDYVAPTRFWEFIDENVQLNVDHIQSASIRASNRVLRTDRQVINKKGAAGDVIIEHASKGMGLAWKYCLGTATPVIATPTNGVLARTQTFIMGDPFNQSLSFQSGRPSILGVVNAFSYVGCKVANWEFFCELDGIGTLKMVLDSQNEDTTRALAAASYASGFELLNYTGGQATIAGANVDVQKFHLMGDMGLATDRRFLRTSTLKKQPIVNAYTGLTGKMDLEFTDLTAYNRFVNGTLAAVTITLTGSLIETVASPGPYFNKLSITLPNVRFDGTTPTAGGPDLLKQELPFTVLYDGTNEPITVVLTTTDTAI